MDDAPVSNIWLRYFHKKATACSDIFTKRTGVRVSRYKSAQLWIREENLSVNVIGVVGKQSKDCTWDLIARVPKKTDVIGLSFTVITINW